MTVEDNNTVEDNSVSGQDNGVSAEDSSPVTAQDGISKGLEAKADESKDDTQTQATPDESESTSDDNSNTDDTQDTDTQEDESPEWFQKDKYKSIEEQAKAYNDLQNKMGKFWGAPNENYKVDDIEGVDENDPLVANLAPALKEVGLSQEGFKHLVKQYQDANIQMMKQYENDLKEHLTQKDASNYQAVNKWMEETLSADEIQQIQNNWLMTPEDFKLLNNLRLMIPPSTNVPSSSDTNIPKFESSQEVENDKVKYRKDIKEGLRSRDKNFEQELAQRYRDARQREMRKK